MTFGRRAANALLGCRVMSMMLLASGCLGHGPSSVIARATRTQVYATVLQEIARDAAAPLVLFDTLLPTHDIDAELRDKVLGDLTIPRRALTAAFGREPVITGEGGSIPVVGDFQRLLNVPVLLVGFGLPGENAHAPDEWISVENFEVGMRAMAALWDELAAT